MRRAEIWWAQLPEPVGRRPVVLLSRDEAYAVRELITVAPITTKARGLPVEVPLGPDDGLPRPCVANLDTVTTISKRALALRVGALSPSKLLLLDDALRFAFGLE